MPTKSTFLDKVLGRIGRLDAEGLQTVVQRLARERRFLETLFEVIEDGVLVLDEQQRILYSNQAAGRLLGWKGDDQIEGELLSRFLPEVDLPKMMKSESKGAQRVIRHEFEIQFPRPRYLRLYAAPLAAEKDGKSRLALILHDATEARQQTFEAIESERLHSLTLLAASVAHEIGNPISALMGLQDLVLAGGLAPEEEHDFLTRMRKETERIHRILRDLLQFARPAAQPLAGEAEQDPGDVETAARDTAALVAPQRSLQEVTLTLDVSPGLPPVTLGHEPLMQVILNLVMNAADAVSKGGKVRVAASRSGERVRLLVEDDGPGVDPRVQAQLFEPFVTTKDVGKGTGLGLAVCRGLVEAAGGTIALDTEFARGARFVVELPIRSD